MGFEPTPPGRLVLKTSALDHSATISPDRHMISNLFLNEIGLSIRKLFITMCGRQGKARLRMDLSYPDIGQ